MPFDLHQLSVFHAVATGGSLGRASVSLNVTQPALSRTIQRLESQIGAPLFERHTKGMQLTDVGHALLPHATQLLRESDLAQEEIQSMLGFTRGTIRVGVVGSVACGTTFAQAIEATCKNGQQLQVEVIEGVWERLADALVAREIDLALGADTPDTDEVVAIRDCSWHDTCCIVAGKCHPLRQKSELTLADTLQYRWVMPPQGTAPYEQMRMLFAEHHLPTPCMVAQTRSAIVQKNLVSQSDFLSWMPEPMFETERNALLIDSLNIPGTRTKRTLVAFRRRVGMMPGPAIRLLEELRRLVV